MAAADPVPSPQRAMRRARWIAPVPLLAGAAALVGMAAVWLMPELRLGAMAGVLGQMGQPVDPGLARFPGALVPMILISLPALVFAGTMLVLSHLFRRMAGGKLIDARNAQLVSRVGVGFLVLALVSTLSGTLAVLALTASNPPGERVLSVGLSSAGLGSIAAGLAFWGLGLVLAEAARIADEHAEIL